MMVWIENKQKFLTFLVKIFNLFFDNHNSSYEYGSQNDITDISLLLILKVGF